MTLSLVHLLLEVSKIVILAVAVNFACPARVKSIIPCLCVPFSRLQVYFYLTMTS